MKFKQWMATVALAAASAAATAAPVTVRDTLGDISCASTGVCAGNMSTNQFVSGAFEDWIPFELLSSAQIVSGNVAATKVRIRGVASSSIADLALGIFDADDNSLVAAMHLASTGGLIDVNLDAGDYYFKVTGTGVGSNGQGAYFLAWATEAGALPEPASLALAAGALGALGWARRRRAA